MREENLPEVGTREDLRLNDVRIVSVEMAQQLLGGVTYRQVGLMLQRGEIRGCKVGSRRMIDLSSIDEYIDEKLAEAQRLRDARQGVAA